MSKLGDDELVSILDWISDHKDRDSFSRVSKQWLRVEGLTRVSLRVLDHRLLPNFLPRFPNLLAFESFMPTSNTHLRLLAGTCPSLEVLNLSLSLRRSRLDEEFEVVSDFDNVGDDGICAVAKGCLRLTKVLLRRRKNVGNVGVVALAGRAKYLTNLDLGMCNLIDDRSLEALAGLNLIRVLNLGGCSLITDRGLAFLATGSASRTLRKLVLEECDRITDYGVSLLRQMCCLEDLNLAECGPKVTDDGAIALASISSLKRLNISWLINVSDVTLVAIAEKCQGLVALDLTGCELITGAGVRAFAHHQCLESLVLAACYNLAGDDLDVLFRCKSLWYVVLSKALRMWIPLELLENISKICKVHWR